MTNAHGSRKLAACVRAAPSVGRSRGELRVGSFLSFSLHTYDAPDLAVPTQGVKT